MAVAGIALDPAGSGLVSGARDGELILFDIETAAAKRKSHTLRNVVTDSKSSLPM